MGSGTLPYSITKYNKKERVDSSVSKLFTHLFLLRQNCSYSYSQIY